jgi:CcmD family protein
MNYLFSAYAIIWILLSVYLFTLGRRQSKLLKEIDFLKNLVEK